MDKLTQCLPLFWSTTPTFEEYTTGKAGVGWNYSTPVPRPLYTIWQEMVALAMKSPQEQWDNFFNIVASRYLQWGYSDKEIRWWMLRTGQGPQCFRQFPGVGPGALPPYEAWRDWHFARGYTTGIPVLQPPSIYAQSFVMCVTNYATPGYVEPFLAIHAERQYDISDYASVFGTPQVAIYSYWSALVMQMTPTVSQTLGPQVTPWSDAACAGGSFVHAVPPNWLILNPTIQYGVQSGMCYGPDGLPIAVMFMLDKLTGKQWAQYFNERLSAHSFTVEANWRGPPWPLALGDTLTRFGISDAQLWSLQQKLYNGSISIHSSCKRKSGIQVYGGAIGQILTMVCLAVISAGVLSAIAGAIEAAAAEAAAAAAAAGEEAGFAVEMVSLAAESQETIKIAQTSYKLYSQVTADDPNLLAIGASLVSVGNSTGLGDALVADVIDTSVFDFAGVEGIDFDAGESLATLDIQDAQALTTDAFTTALDEITLEFELDSSFTFDTAAFSGEVGVVLNDAVQTIVGNLDQYDTPEALWAAMTDAANAAVPQTIDAAVESIDDGIGTAIDEIVVDNAVLANSEDFGALTIDELDQVEFEQGIDTGTIEQQIAAELPPTELTLSATDLEQILTVASKIEPLLTQSTIVAAAPTPPPPPPPTSPALIVAAPAPPQPEPIAVATVTYTPEQAALIDGEQGIPLITAGFGPPIAPDGEKGFNLWWLLPLGLLAIPMGEKRRTRKRTRR